MFVEEIRYKSGKGGDKPIFLFRDTGRGGCASET